MRIVEANSVEDYLQRYYKRDRWTDTLLASYLEEFAARGVVCTSRHDNVTGEFIAWPDFPEWARYAVNCTSCGVEVHRANSPKAAQRGTLCNACRREVA